ncbi:MAG: MipA/OmpV family protein [Pseudomonadales bacterium]
MKFNTQQLTSKLALAAIAMGITNSALASDAIGPGDSDSKWILGASTVVVNNIYADEDGLGFLFPNLVYNGDRFFLKNGSLNLHAAQLNDFSFGLTLGVDAGFLSDDDEYRDNTKLAGLIERDEILVGGVYINHTTDQGRLNLTMLGDLGEDRDGYEATLSYTFDLKYGNWNVNPVVGVNWLSDNNVNHAFGVSASEATATRAVYEGGSATNLFAGVRARRAINEHWDLELKTGVSKLGSSIGDSTIVDDDEVYHAGVSVNYNF